MSDFADLQTDGSVAYLTLNRPEVHNAQNRQMLEEASAALAEIEKDTSLNVVVVRGNGRSFSAGHDLKEAQERSHYTIEQRWAYEHDLYFGLCQRLRELRQPTIAAVQGHCVAAGFMIAAMCDLIVAADDAKFSDPVVRKLGAAAVEVLFHPWALGPRLALDMLLTGRTIDAEEARHAGLVSRIVATEDLAAETESLAKHIAGTPPFAAQLVKRSIRRTLDIQGMSNALSSHFDSHMLTHYTKEWSDVTGERLSDALSRDVS